MANGKTQRELQQESEQRVRLKLDSILAPEGDLGALELGDIIDASALQRLMDNFYALAHIPMTIMDTKGKMLVGVGWQDICMKFHRVHPQTCQHCLESDTLLAAGAARGEFKLYKCKNNMWDMATPITVGGKHVGNLFMGQFFFEGEALPYDVFRSQARRYGFKEDEYLAALDRVPRLDRQAVDTAVAFFLQLAETLSQLSYSNVRLARSVAERDSLAASLRAGEQRLSRAQEIAHLGSWELDLVHNRLSWSDEVYRIFGLQPQTFAATYEAFLEAVHPEDRAAVDAAYSGSLREGRDTYEIEHRVVRKADGEIRFVHEKCEHMRDESGRIIRSVGMVHDITERRKRERELQQLNRTLQALSSSDQAMLRAKDESEYLKEVCRIILEECGHAMVWVGYAEQDEHKTVRPVAQAGFDEGYIDSLKITWADNERGRGPTGTAIRTGKISMCRNMLTDPAFEPWRQQALNRGYASSIVLPLMADDRAFGALTIYSREPDSFSEDEVRLLSDLAGDLAHGITAIRLREAHARAAEDLRELSENLKRSNQDLEQFAYVASHDLQEPLRMVAGYLQLIERRYKDKLDQDAREFIGFAVDGAIRMSRLITDLLEYSRINIRGRPPEPVAVETVLAQALKNLQVSIAETGAVITYDPLPTICGDGPQLVQLLQNLIGNAIKFRHPDRPCQIHVASRRNNSEWVFSVRDNGIGIDPQYAERIFLIFQRLHSRKQYPGTGIGLAICKRIVERHGGRIWVESSLGQGATFFFTAGA